MIRYDAWSTADELHYIDGLGTHRLRAHCDHRYSPLERESLLRNYLKSLDRREAWDPDVDPIVVRQAVLEALAPYAKPVSA